MDGTQHGRRGRKSAGFSLVELLVVISIIAMLASMLIPVIGIVRDQARSTKCRSNLRQMQMANIDYVGNWGDYVPAFFNVNAGSSTYTNQLIQNTEFIQNCTDGKVTDGTIANYPASLLCPLSKPDPTNAYSQYSLSYGYNQQYVVWPYQAAYDVGPKLATGRPTQLIAFVDALDWCMSNWWVLGNAYWASGTALPEGVYSYQATAFRHQKRANVVYMDGHVGSGTYSDLNVYKSWSP